MRAYDPKEIEEKWQAIWEDKNLFRVCGGPGQEEVLPA